MGIAWVLVAVSFCAGMIGAVVTSYVLTTKQIKELNKQREYFSMYMSSLDKTAGHMEDYVNKKLEIIVASIRKLHDLDLDFHKHAVDALNSSNNIETNILKSYEAAKDYIFRSSSLLESLFKDFNEQIKLLEINDRRWELIQEYITKGGQENEHEDGETETGTPESGDARDQETEQAEVLSGETDGELVQPELAEDRLDGSSEAEKV